MCVRIESMRLDKCLEKAGLGSRNQVKRLFKAKQIKVDGKRATRLSQIVDPNLQDITVSGKTIELEPAVYYLLNKPAGVVTAVSDKNHQTVIDLIDKKDFRQGLYPIGRLDRDTEGLLLVTNNGPLGYRMLHPKHHVKKTYELVVNGFLADDAVGFFAKGVRFLDGRVCQPAELKIVEANIQESRAFITISEGKFHQVKKMFLAYGVKVIFLKRVSFGGFRLDPNLQVGAYRPLNDEEQLLLKTYLD